MNKETSTSSKPVETILEDQNSLENIVASVGQLPSIVIDRMLAHAAQELEKRKLVERDEAILKILEIVKRFSIPFDEITNLLENSDAIFANHADNGKYRKIFVNPDNPKDIWIGAGRRPQWVIDKVGKKGDVTPFAKIIGKDTQQKFYFFNPKKPTQRWNGLGRKPFWFKELEANGIDVDQYKTFF